MSQKQAGFSVALFGRFSENTAAAITKSTSLRAVLARQTASFVGVGLVATALHYTVLVSMVQVLHASPVPSALLGFCVGGCVSYGLNRRLTFNSDRPHREAAWRFIAVSLVGFVLTLIMMAVLVDRLHWPYLVAQVLTTAVVMVWNFLANRLWTFAELDEVRAARLAVQQASDVRKPVKRSAGNAT